MFKQNLAILVDNFQQSDNTQNIIQAIINQSQYEVVIFTLCKENIVPNPLAVFSIADYFNFDGISIITSPKTLAKSISYPAMGPKIIIGKVKYQDYYNIDIFDLNLIDGVLNGNHQNVGRPNPTNVN